MTFGDIGYIVGVSRYRAEVICERAVAKLERVCKRAGINAADVLGGRYSMIATAERWA